MEHDQRAQYLRALQASVYSAIEKAERFGTRLIVQNDRGKIVARTPAQMRRALSSRQEK